MDELERYLSEHYWSEDDVLREVRADIAERGPQIQVSAEAGRLLALLVRLAGATRVLELGTLFGYSGIWMARELPPDGHLDTVERETLHADAAEHWFERAGLADRVTVHRGAAPRRDRDAARPLRRGLHRRRQGRLSGVRQALAGAAAARRHRDRRQRHPARPHREAGIDADMDGMREMHDLLGGDALARGDHGAGRRRPGPGRQAELSGVTTYSPSPRPTFDGPAAIPYASVTRHIWGDPEAGEVADWIYASTERVHALVFGLAPGAWFRHSPEFRTVFGADELLYVLRGTMVLANPETGEVLRVPRGGTAFFRADTWHHVHAHGNEELRVLELYAPPPATGSSGAYARTKPYLEPADWRYGDDSLLGHLPGGEPARRTLYEPPLVWRRSLGSARRPLLQHRASDRGSARAEPRRDLGRHAHGGDEVVYALEGVLHVRAFGENGNSVFELNPDDAAFIPKGVAHEYRSYGSAPGARAVRRRARLSAMTLAIGIDVGGTKIAGGLVDTATGLWRRASSGSPGPSARPPKCWTTASRWRSGWRPGEQRPDRHRRLRAGRPRGPHAVGADDRLARRPTSRAHSPASARRWSRATCAPRRSPRLASAAGGGSTSCSS